MPLIWTNMFYSKININTLFYLHVVNQRIKHKLWVYREYFPPMFNLSKSFYPSVLLRRCGNWRCFCLRRNFRWLIHFLSKHCFHDAGVKLRRKTTEIRRIRLFNEIWPENNQKHSHIRFKSFSVETEFKEVCPCSVFTDEVRKVKQTWDQWF